MNDKERLEFIAGNWEYGRCVRPEDVEWLISQAEKVEKLQTLIEQQEELIISERKESMELYEKLQQAQAKIEQYERARQSYLQACDELEAHANKPDIVLSIVSELRQALEG
jgi:chromosome segregation ATPase